MTECILTNSHDLIVLLDSEKKNIKKWVKKLVFFSRIKMFILYIFLFWTRMGVLIKKFLINKYVLENS